MRKPGSALLAAGLLTACMLEALCGERPIVIAHRGASGERPEHTLEGYRLAIEQGADFVEPDLVATKDGVLVCRHENEISGTTDVASRPEFQARRATKTIDGVPVTGWFTEDFTLAELKTLRARERLPQLRGTAFDGRFEVPSFEELLALVAEASAGPSAAGADRRLPRDQAPVLLRGARTAARAAAPRRPAPARPRPCRRARVHPVVRGPEPAAPRDAHARAAHPARRGERAPLGFHARPLGAHVR